MPGIFMFASPPEKSDKSLGLTGDSVRRFCQTARTASRRDSLRAVLTTDDTTQDKT